MPARSKDGAGPLEPWMAWRGGVGVEGAVVMVWQLWSVTLLALVGTIAACALKLDFFQSKMGLNHLVLDETLGMVYLGAD